MEIGTKKLGIQGWGVDLDPADRPAYPMWKPVEDTGSAYEEEDIPKQKVNFRELRSIERSAMTPVYGQTVPPSGLSGLVRKFAFRFSEGSFGHWLPLLLADRINVGEGLVSDLFHLRVPNLWKEMGLSAEWKYNRTKFVRKTAMTTAIVVGAAGLFLALSPRQRA